MFVVFERLVKWLFHLSAPPFPLVGSSSACAASFHNVLQQSVGVRHRKPAGRFGSHQQLRSGAAAAPPSFGNKDGRASGRMGRRLPAVVPGRERKGLFPVSPLAPFSRLQSAARRT